MLMKKKYLQALYTCVLIAFLAFSCTGFIKPSTPAITNDQAAALPSQWDLAFSRRSGWTGGDVAASFVIPRNRVLWVFGDSFVGEVEGGRHVRATLVNNAIAVHPYGPGRPGTAPAPEKISFFWGPADESGKPTAWVRPAQKDRPGAAGSKTWYWPTGGGVVLPGPGGSKRLALFLILLEKKQGQDSLWAFQCVGSAVAMIDNVEEPARLWKTRVIDLPHQISGDPKDAQGGGQVDWGAASLYEPGAGGSPGYVFIYGVVSDPSNNKDLVLARVNPSGIEDFAQWEFYGQGEKWLKSPDLAGRIVKGVASELSVDRVLGKKGGAGYVMVYSEPLFGDRIFARTSQSTEGPWSDAKPVFTVPEVKKSKNYFAYAAKGHASLSMPGALLISYIVNSHDFTELINDASIYRPRFIIFPIEDLEK